MGLPCAGTCWRREKRSKANARLEQGISEREERGRDKVRYNAAVVLGEECVTEQSSPIANITILYEYL